MALTAKEEAFYRSFLKLLESEGITQDNPHRFSEIVSFDDYDVPDVGLEKNVLTLALIEHGENTPFKDMPDTFDNCKDISELNMNPNYLDTTKYSEEKKQEIRENAPVMNAWYARNLKNPFVKDEPRGLSEKHIKDLYKSFTQGRLGRFHVAYANDPGRENDFSYFYEAEDGSVKLTPSLIEVQKKFPFTLEHVAIVENVAGYLNDENPELKEYFVKEFGKEILDSAKVLLQYDKKEPPQKPGRLMTMRATFGGKKAQEQVKAYKDYEKAMKHMKECVEKIAKKAYPDAKNSLAMLRNAEPEMRGIVGADVASLRFIAQLDHREKTKQQIAQKVDQLTLGRDKQHKSALKFALESEYNTFLTKNAKDFLLDIPNVYTKLIQLKDDIEIAGNTMRHLFVMSEKAPENKKLLAKIAICKLMQDDIANTEFNKEAKTDLISLMNRGQGEKVVQAFVNVMSEKEDLTKEETLSQMLSNPASAMKEKYKEFAETVRQLTRNLNPEKARETNVASGKKVRDVRNILENPAKTTFSKKEIDSMREICAQDFKRQPTVEKFVLWKAFDASYTHMTQNASVGKLEKDIVSATIEQIQKEAYSLPEFMDELEAGKYSTLRMANGNFAKAQKEMHRTQQPAEGEVQKAGPKIAGKETETQKQVGNVLQ